MNIVIVSPEFINQKHFDGGLANYTYKLARWLLENGHSVKVFTLGENNHVEVFQGIELHTVEHKDYFWKLSYYLKRLKLRQLFCDEWLYKFHFKRTSRDINKAILSNRERRIDLIHFAHLGGLGFKKPKNIPSVVRLSGSTELCQNLGGYGASDL